MSDSAGVGVAPSSRCAHEGPSCCKPPRTPGRELAAAITRAHARGAGAWRVSAGASVERGAAGAPRARAATIDSMEATITRRTRRSRRSKRSASTPTPWGARPRHALACSKAALALSAAAQRVCSSPRQAPIAHAKAHGAPLVWERQPCEDDVRGTAPRRRSGGGVGASSAAPEGEHDHCSLTYRGSWGL